MSLFGEICPTGGLGDQGSRIEGRPERGEPPSNPKVASLAMGAGLRAIAKAVEEPPDPNVIQPARLAATPGVMGQKPADGLVAKRPP
jgi:hypothetical protein